MTRANDTAQISQPHRIRNLALANGAAAEKIVIVSDRQDALEAQPQRRSPGKTRLVQGSNSHFHFGNL
jgi:hypothetical protein